MHDFAAIAQDDDDVSVTTTDDDNVYKTADDVHDFAAIAQDNNDVSVAAQVSMILTRLQEIIRILP